MTIKSNNYVSENQFVPHHINMWYDRHTRNWVVQLLDVYNNQIDDALYSYTKHEAIVNKKQLQKQYDID